MTRLNTILLIFALLLLGCEKVIDVDLNESNPVIVIEGKLSDNLDFTEVKITKTSSYFDADQAEKISGADVSITDDRGHFFRLNEIEEGIYIPYNLLPRTGFKYKLSVEVEDQVYESVSTLNQAVKIDSLAVVYNEGFSFLDDGYNVNMYIRDPKEVKNFYRLKIYINNELEDDANDLILFNDKNTNGSLVEVQIRRKLFQVGDTVKYELISMDEAAYLYLDAISEIIGDGSQGTAAPANPNPNFTNGALGYFSAYSSDEKTIIVTEITD
jgi:hypothetical protein